MPRKSPEKKRRKNPSASASHRWKLDFDYLDDLSDDDLSWLREFCDEYVQGVFHARGDDDCPADLFRTQEERREIWRAARAGRRDIANLRGGRVPYSQPLHEQWNEKTDTGDEYPDPEDRMIAYVDARARARRMFRQPK